MKKLFYLLLVFGLFACSSDSDVDNNDNQQNMMRINNDKYFLEKGVIQNWGRISLDDEYYSGNCVGYYDLALVFGQSSMPNNIFSSPYTYTGYYINMGFVDDDLIFVQNKDVNYSGTTLENCNFIWGDYDFTFNEQGGGTDDESWVSFGGGLLSVEKSGDIYTVEFSSIDEDGNNIEVYYNGAISYWEY